MPKVIGAVGTGEVFRRMAGFVLRASVRLTADWLRLRNGCADFSPGFPVSHRSAAPRGLPTDSLRFFPQGNGFRGLAPGAARRRSSRKRLPTAIQLGRWRCYYARCFGLTADWLRRWIGFADLARIWRGFAGKAPVSHRSAAPRGLPTDLLRFSRRAMDFADWRLALRAAVARESVSTAI